MFAHADVIDGTVEEEPARPWTRQEWQRYIDAEIRAEAAHRPHYPLLGGLA